MKTGGRQSRDVLRLQCIVLSRERVMRQREG